MTDRAQLCIDACDGLDDEELKKIIAWNATVADDRAASAATLLTGLGWKVIDNEGREWEREKAG